MIPELPEQAMPDWLTDVDPDLGPLPIRDVLISSVYYPSCGFDGSPVQYLGGNFHSFIYVNYGVERQQMISNLGTFKGYSLLASRDVTPDELTPYGWTPTFPTPEDGNPQSHAGWIKPPFGVWSVLERTEEYGPEHGPDRFSLLYIGGDGVATFQALYHGNKVAPAVVAVIQPGHGFGGNWTDFEDPAKIFGRSVLGNPAGAPEFLLFGGWVNSPSERHFYEHPCWPQYSVQVRRLTDYGSLRLWARAGFRVNKGKRND